MRNIILLRVALWCCGLALFAWALGGARFRDAEGSLAGSFCLPLSAGVALLLLGWAVACAPAWRKLAYWLTLALVGQAVALQLIEAGPLIRYQHYKPLSRLFTETHPLLLIYLAAQTAIVVRGLGQRWPNVRAALGHAFQPWQLFCIGLVFVFSSATVSPTVGAYAAELCFAVSVQTLNLATIVLTVCALPEEALASLKRKFDHLFGSAAGAETEGTRRVDGFAVGGAVWVVTLAAVLSVVSYQRHPHIPDEVTYYFHARYLAAGVLTLPPPPVPDAFNVYLMELDGGRWYTCTPPGWALALAVGFLLGVPWLVNPLLGGLNVLLAYALIRELYDRRAARLGVLLLCLSPWFVFMAMNFMTHTLTLTCALVAALGVARAQRLSSLRWAFIAGCGVGLVGLIRPLDGVIVAATLGLWALGAGGRRLAFSRLAAFGAGAALLGAGGLAYNRALTGSLFSFPVNAYFDRHFWPKANALGFGPERGLNWPFDPFPGHGPLEAAINADLNLFSLNIELFGWGTGSLILIALVAFVGKKRRGDRLMLAAIASVFIAHIFYWFSGGPDFGARYWFLMIVPCVALTVSAIRLLEQRFADVPLGSPATNRVRVTCAVLLLCALALVNYFPWRAVDKYHRYLRMRPDVVQLAEDYNFSRSLVLIRGQQHPDYASAWVYNPLDLRADAPVYAWDKDPETRAEVLKAYADRPVWVVNGPTVTRRGFEVVAGPLAALDLAALDGQRR